MFRFKTAAVISLFSLIWSFAAASAEETPLGKVIMRDTSDRYETRTPEPWLIPISLLARQRDQWSRDEKALVSEQLYGKFLDVVEATRDKGLSGHCYPSEGLGGSHDALSPEIRSTVAGIAGTRKTVVVAEVLTSESAWDGIFRRIVTLVYLKVTRVVRAVEPIAVNDVLTLSRPWGTVNVRGVTLCSYSASQPQDSGRPTATIPERVRQQLLLVGNLEPGNRIFMETGGFGEFQIINGFVHYPQTFSFYREQKPETLTAVIAGISGSAQQ